MKQGKVIPKQSVYAASSTPLHSIGDSCELPGGRVFYYAKVGSTALSAGYMCTQATNVANHRRCSIAANVAVGAKRIRVTLGATAVTQNYYANGWLAVVGGAGAGGLYRIKSHLAAAGGANVWIELYDPVIVALTAGSSIVTLTKSLWDEVVIYPATTPTGPPVGVPLVDIPASGFGWLQTWGLAAVHMNTTMTIGAPFGVSGTAGSGVTISGAGVTHWGTVVNPSNTTERSLVHLTIAP